jgi:hypothetical protein
VCSLEHRYQVFREMCCLHVGGCRVSWAHRTDNDVGKGGLRLQWTNRKQSVQRTFLNVQKFIFSVSLSRSSIPVVLPKYFSLWPIVHYYSLHSYYYQFCSPQLSYNPPPPQPIYLVSCTTLLPIGQIFSSSTSFLKNHPFTWTLIPVALLIAPVLSFHPTFLLAFSICSYFSVLKMETAGSSDMVVHAYECTPCHTTGDHNLHTYCYGNLNSRNI